MTSQCRPPQGFAKRPLTIRIEKAGAIWCRLYRSHYPDPLGYGFSQTRFSDPEGDAFGVIYLGSTLKVSFHEVLIRDQGDGRLGPFTMKARTLKEMNCAQIEIAEDLTLIDLTGDGPFRMGVPTDVVGARDQKLAREWSAAFHAHERSVDGIYYPSRLNEERNVALYDRALHKLRVSQKGPLIELRDPLAAILNDLEINLR